MFDLTSAGASDTMNGALSSMVLDLVRTMMDAKTAACCNPYKQFSALKGALRPVEVRAMKAHPQYVAHARVLDRKIYHTASGVAGPIEAKLLEFGALGGDHAHEVLGLVVSAFGELSPAFYELANAIARVRALKHLSYFACRKDRACEMHKQPIIRLQGLTAQRGWPCLIPDRLDALVSAAPTHGNAAGHVDDAAENYNFFSPDHGNGTAGSAGFGWRGGGA
jgi:hypothetical protein